MKLAFNVEKAEAPARNCRTGKRSSRNRLTTRRLPAVTNETPAVAEVVIKDVEPVPVNKESLSNDSLQLYLN